MKRVLIAGVAVSLMAGAAMAAERGTMAERVAAAQRSGDGGRQPFNGPAANSAPQPNRVQGAGPGGPVGGGQVQAQPRPQAPPQVQAQPQPQPQAQAQARPQAQVPAQGGGGRGPGGFQNGGRGQGGQPAGRGAPSSGPNFPVGPLGNPPVQTPRGGFPVGSLVQPSQPQRTQPQGRGQPPQAQGRGPTQQPGRAGPDRGQPDRRVGAAPSNSNWDQNRYGRPVSNGGVFERQRDFGRNWYSPDRFRPSYRAPRPFVVSNWRPPTGFYLRSWYSGDYLPLGWYDPPTYLDWAYFGLPFPPIGCEWVRVGRDATLVDIWSGEVLSIEYDLFF